ncbi:gliding motility-associated C-terminal domain-containing protein [Flavobacteriales bacterium]|nr:gliding motility-associated C-terminal domain-containing protein [Flavobacteriales bacterium]
MIAKRKILGILLTLITVASFSQNTVWYFGRAKAGLTSYGLDFSDPTSPSYPAQRNFKSKMDYYESVSVVSDNDGNVLYYSDGIFLYDASHEIMFGAPAQLKGTGNGTTASSVQGAYSLLKPGSITEYYLFTSQAIDGGAHGFRVNRIDMALPGNGTVDSPLGAVVTADSVLRPTGSEMMTAYGNCGSDTAWVITHEPNSWNFVTVLVTSNGLQSLTIQNVETPRSFGGGFNMSKGRGSMDINAEGTHLILTGQNPIGTHVLDFNKHTGVLSNPREIMQPAPNDHLPFDGYASEFSPDGTKAYFASNIISGMFQHDFTDSTSTWISAASGETHGEIILGVDNKLYVGKPLESWTNGLGVINNPNNAAASINYNPNQHVFEGGGHVSYAMPQGFFCPLNPKCEIDSVAEVCNTDASFQFTSNMTGDWGGGAYITIGGMFDPAVAGEGTHWITFQGDCDEPDSVQIIVVLCCPSIDVDLGSDISACASETHTLNAGTGFASYEWIENGIVMGGETSATISADSGTYIVNVTNGDDCPGTDTIVITTLALPIPTITGDNFYCVESSVTLDAGAGYDFYAWSPSGGSSRNATISSAGTYTVTVENSDGCLGTDDITITERTLPSPTITGSNIVCEDNSTDLTGTAGSGGALVWTGISPFVSPLTITSAGTYVLTETDASGCIDSIEHIVIMENSPSVDIGDLFSICETQETQTLDASTGVSNDTYDWSTGSSDSSIEAATAGEYSVIVTSENGCKAFDTAIVSAFTLPEVDLGPSTFFCSGDSLSLNAGAGFSDYKWSTGDSVQFIYVNFPGPVSVVVKDANGCLDSSSIQVSANGLPSVELLDLTVCEKDSITINAEHPEAFLYTWIPGNINSEEIKVGSEDATYTVTIVDNDGCEFTDSVQISEEKLPTVDLGVDLIICDNVTETLDATSSSEVSYAWFLDRANIPDEDSPTLEADSGEYIVIVSTVNGCESSDSINIDNHQLPNIVIDNEYEFCKFDSVEIDLGNIGDLYSWSTSDSTSSIWVYSAGDISLKVTDSNSCVVSANTTLIENPLPAVDLGNHDSACVGLNIKLDAQPKVGFGPYTFIWSDGETDSIYNLVGPDTLSVIVTNTNTNCMVYDTIKIAALDSLEMLFDDGDHQVCQGAESESPLNAGSFNGASYTWLLPDGETETTQEIVPLLNGWYTINVTDQYNCEGYDSVLNVVIPTPNIDLGPDTSFCSLGSDTYTITMKFYENVLGTISWNDDNNNLNDSLFTARYTPSTVIGSFLDTATGCVHVDSVELTEFCEPTLIQFPNVFVPGSEDGNGTFRPIGIIDGNFKDYVNNIVWSDFEVFNRWGLKVFQSSDVLPNWDGVYENRPVASGVYYWVYRYKDSSLKEYTFNGFTQAIQTRD